MTTLSQSEENCLGTDDYENVLIDFGQKSTRTRHNTANCEVVSYGRMWDWIPIQCCVMHVELTSKLTYWSSVFRIKVCNGSPDRARCLTSIIHPLNIIWSDKWVHWPWCSKWGGRSHDPMTSQLLGGPYQGQWPIVWKKLPDAQPSSAVYKYVSFQCSIVLWSSQRRQEILTKPLLVKIETKHLKYYQYFAIVSQNNIFRIATCEDGSHIYR
jgi:hypothetical protein